MSDAAGHGQKIRWDASGARRSRSDVATATLNANHVMLNFGEHRGEDRPGREQGVTLLTRIALRPVTAKHLSDMLTRLVAETRASMSSPG